MDLTYSSTLKINGHNISYQQFISASNKLEDIKKCTISKEDYYNSRKYSFEEIQQMIPERDRINIDEYMQVEESSKDKIINELYKVISDIDNLLEKIESSSNTKLTYLIAEYGIENILTEEERENNLLTFLMINGYLDENYEEYTNYFYPGALKTNDKTFLISLQSQKALKYEYPLNDYKDLIEEIPIKSFYQKEIFNFGLLDFMLKNNKNYQKELKIFFKQLSNESDRSVDFCTEFLRKTEYKDVFIIELCKEWTGIWKYIYAYMNDDIKKIYMYNILKYVSISEIQKINEIEPIGNYIAVENDFISNFVEVEQIKKIKQIISILNIKFETINSNDITAEIGEFITNNNYYKINKYMIDLILEKKYQTNPEKISNKNYTSIRETKDINFIQYIKENFLEYIEEVYLLSKQDLRDDINDIIDIVNNENLLLEHKQEIIKREVAKIESLEDIDSDIWKEILEEDKMIINWKNIICYFSENEFSSELIKYINNHKESLTTEKIQKYNYDINIYGEFNKTMVLQEQIHEELLDCIDYKLPIEILKSKVKSSRIRKIIERNNIIVDENSYQLIQEEYNELLIIFIENNINFFIDNMDSLLYDEEEIENILISENIEDVNKILIANNLNDNIICTNETYANKYVELIISSNTKVTLSIQLIKSIIDLVLPTKGIKLLINQADNLDEEQFLDILDNFAYPYNAIRGQKNPKFEKNDINNEFIKMIKRKNISNVSSIIDKDENYCVYKKRN